MATENIEYKKFFQVTFDRKETHPIQTYIKKGTIVRWNHKDEKTRKIVYKLEHPDDAKEFIKMFRFLIEEHKRYISVKKLPDLFCNECGVQYLFSDQSGQKTCSDCGNEEFETTSGKLIT